MGLPAWRVDLKSFEKLVLPPLETELIQRPLPEENLGFITLKFTNMRWNKTLLLICLLYVIPKMMAMENQRWEVLFDGKNTDKWRSLKTETFPSQGWEIKDGALVVKNKSKAQDIITKEVYNDFELVFDFKLTVGANSGIKYLVEKIKNNDAGTMEWNGPEYQIIDDNNHPAVKGHVDEKASTASLYLVYAPENKQLHPAGEWNNGKIIVKGNRIEHWLNGVKVVDCERSSQDFRDRMANTKFKVYDKYGELPAGHIMLTDHDGDPCYFRNIRIRRL